MDGQPRGVQPTRSLRQESRSTRHPPSVRRVNSLIESVFNRVKSRPPTRFPRKTAWAVGPVTSPSGFLNGLLTLGVVAPGRLLLACGFDQLPELWIGLQRLVFPGRQARPEQEILERVLAEDPMHDEAERMA